MKDILNSIKVTLNERITSPLAGTFVLAFLTINYKMIAVLFSDLDVLEAIKYIDETLYGGKWSKFKYFLAYPAAASVGYLLLFPWLSRWAMTYETWQSEKTKAKRRQLLELQVLDEEESYRLIQLHDQLEDKYTKELAEKRKHIAELEDFIKGMMSSEDSAPESDTEQAPQKDELHVTDPSKLRRHTIRHKGRRLQDEEVRILELFALNDNISVENGFSRSGLSPREFDVFTKQLITDGLLAVSKLSSSKSELPILHLTEEGKVLTAKKGLAKKRSPEPA